MGNRDNETADGTNVVVSGVDGDGKSQQLLVDTSGRPILSPTGGGVPASASTATLANVAGSASSVTLQASNSSRLGWSVFNDSAANLYVKFGSTASATSFTVKVGVGEFYELPTPVYTGIITGIWDSATGAARVTELSA